MVRRTKPSEELWLKFVGYSLNEASNDASFILCAQYGLVLIAESVIWVID